MLMNFTDNKKFVTCPRCGKALLRTTEGELEIVCSNVKCACKIKVRVHERKLDYEFVENDKNCKTAS